MWRELSAELESEDPLAAAAAAAARAAAHEPDRTAPPGVATRLRSLLPGLLRATLTAGGKTAVLALPLPAEASPSTGGSTTSSSTSSISLSLPLRNSERTADRRASTGRRSCGERDRDGSITFELAQPPNASLLRLLQRFARLLGRRLSAEQQHLAKAQLEVGGWLGG